MVYSLQGRSKSCAIKYWNVYSKLTIVPQSIGFSLINISLSLLLIAMISYCITLQVSVLQTAVNLLSTAFVIPVINGESVECTRLIF